MVKNSPLSVRLLQLERTQVTVRKVAAGTVFPSHHSLPKGQVKNVDILQQRLSLFSLLQQVLKISHKALECSVAANVSQ